MEFSDSVFKIKKFHFKKQITKNIYFIFVCVIETRNKTTRKRKGQRSTSSSSDTHDYASINKNLEAHEWFKEGEIKLGENYKDGYIHVSPEWLSSPQRDVAARLLDMMHAEDIALFIKSNGLIDPLIKVLIWICPNFFACQDRCRRSKCITFWYS